MKKKKKLFNMISVFMTFLFVFILSTTSVGAIFRNDTKVVNYKVDKNNNKLNLEIEYQYGLKEIIAYICKNYTSNLSTDCTTTFSTSDVTINENLNSDRDIYENDNFSVDGLSLQSYIPQIDDKGKADNEYYIIVYASVCASRTADGKDCYTWLDSKEILRDTFNLSTGLTNNSVLDGTLSKALYITNTYIIPILWLGLGVLLIVRGILLAVQIVKSSDEPDVRRTKISGLIWLVVGVLIGYIVTFSASIVMSMFGYGGLF